MVEGASGRASADHPDLSGQQPTRQYRDMRQRRGGGGGITRAQHAEPGGHARRPPLLVGQHLRPRRRAGELPQRLVDVSSRLRRRGSIRVAGSSAEGRPLMAVLTFTQLANQYDPAIATGVNTMIANGIAGNAENVADALTMYVVIIGGLLAFREMTYPRFVTHAL